MPSPNSSVCSLHFQDHDFIQESQDSNLERKKKRSDKSLILHKLKPTAFPSKYPNFPSYQSITVPEPRTETTSVKARFKADELRLDVKIKDYFCAQKVHNLTDLMTKLKKEKLPEKVCVLYETKSEAVFGTISKSHASIPELSFSLVITENLEYQMFCKSVTVPHKEVKNICNEDFIENITNVLNLVKHMDIISLIFNSFCQIN
jgi:hypothetical protein